MIGVLDSRMKALKRDGIGIEKKQAEPISNNEEDILWKEGLLGDKTPNVLVDTIIWMCGIYFALRGGAELRDLKRYQIKVGESPEGAYLEYKETASKITLGD